MPTFKCSGENWPNSSCYFPSHKWVFFKILHQSLVSWKILFTEETKSTFLRILSAWTKIHQILDSFETTNQFFFKFCINLQCHETQLLCTFLSEILYNFPKRAYQGTYLVKSKVWNFALWCAPFVKII